VTGRQPGPRRRRERQAKERGERRWRHRTDAVHLAHLVIGPRASCGDGGRIYYAGKAERGSSHLATSPPPAPLNRCPPACLPASPLVSDVLLAANLPFPRLFLCARRPPPCLPAAIAAASAGSGFLCCHRQASASALLRGFVNSAGNLGAPY
jgi:hypothetical protein